MSSTATSERSITRREASTVFAVLNLPLVALALVAAMTLAAPAWSQDATGDRVLPPAVGQALEVETLPEAEGGTGGTQGQQPAAEDAVQPTTGEDATTQPAAIDGADGSEASGQPVALPSGEEATTTVETPVEPAPAFLEDPAGAISHLLRQAERDPNLPHDLSPWGMFMMADWVVKAVMILLVVSSLAVWTVWLAKTIEIALAKRRARRAVSAIGRARNLDEAAQALSRRGGPAAFMVRSAKEEVARSAVALDYAGNDGVKERLGARLARIEAQAGRRLSRGTGLLAIVGSTAPFVGLFGTVWGIMNSFIGISEAQTTNLAVVAPGIAEALLATAIGLVAAIPAVVIYNLFARAIAGYAQLLADAASGVEQLVSLELDLRKVPANDPGSPAAQPVQDRQFATAVSAAE